MKFNMLVAFAWTVFIAVWVYILGALCFWLGPCAFAVLAIFCLVWRFVYVEMFK